MLGFLFGLEGQRDSSFSMTARGIDCYKSTHLVPGNLLGDHTLNFVRFISYSSLLPPWCDSTTVKVIETEAFFFFLIEEIAFLLLLLLML